MKDGFWNVHTFYVEPDVTGVTSYTVLIRFARFLAYATREFDHCCWKVKPEVGECLFTCWYAVKKSDKIIEFLWMVVGFYVGWYMGRYLSALTVCDVDEVVSDGKFWNFEGSPKKSATACSHQSCRRSRFCSLQSKTFYLSVEIFGQISLNWIWRNCVGLFVTMCNWSY